jgi:uncharacterized membrane protein (DUF2068 family)
MTMSDSKVAVQGEHTEHSEHNWRERDQLIEAIAIFKFMKAAGLIAIAFGTFKLLEPATAAMLARWIDALSATSEHPIIQTYLVKLSSYSPRRIQAVGIGALLYATLFMVEGFGLWHEAKWAEYLTVVATSLLVPIEVYELVQKVTIPRAAALIINLVAVAYLVWRIRHPEHKIKIFK